MARTPKQGQRAFKSLPERLVDWAVDTLRQWSEYVGAEAIKRMREATGEGRRRSNDTGPLRRLSGRLAASLLGARFRGRQEGINTIRRRRHGASLLKGSRVPYFLVHELGYDGVRSDGRYMKIPARPTLAPAFHDSVPTLRKRAAVNLAKTVRDHLGGR